MADINQLPLGFPGSPQLNDLLMAWSTGNGLSYKLSVQMLQTLLLQSVTLPGGIIAAATTAKLQGGAATPALTATLAPFNMVPTANLCQQWPPASSASAFTFDPVNGRFIANRQIALAQISVALVGSWANAVNLTIGVLVGPAATPYTLPEQSQVTGTGAARTVHFSGLAFNPNNLNAVINQGDYVQLAGALSTPGTLTLTSSLFTMQSLDGV